MSAPYADPEKTSDSVLVGYDCAHGEDKAVLIVGKKKWNKPIEIINFFEGKEATDLWKKLMTVKESKPVTVVEDKHET